MSLLLDDASSEAVVLAATLGISPPFSMGLVFYPDDTADVSTLIGFGDDADPTEAFRLRFRGDLASDFLGIFAEGGATSAEGNTTNAANLNAWNAALAIITSTTDRAVVLNGDWASRGTDTTAITVTAPDEWTVGRPPGSISNDDFFSGRVAEIAIWDSALVQAEAEAHGSLQSPLLVKRSSLIAYLVLQSDSTLYDVISGQTWTLEGTPAAAEHPPMFYPRNFMVLPSPPAAGPQTLELSVSSLLALTQAVNLQLNLQVSNTLNLSHFAKINVILLQAINQILFTQVVAPTLILMRSLSSQLLLSQLVKKGILETASNTLALIQSVARGGNPISALLFTQSLAFVKGKAARNDLVLTQSLNVVKEISVQVSNTLNLTQAVAHVNPDACDQHLYQASGPGFPSLTLGQSSSITLDCGVDSIILRNPEFGNSENIELQRALNTTRGGEVRVFRDPLRPKPTLISITFRMMTQAKSTELFIFLRACLGLEVTYTDLDTEQWIGIITNPQTAITKERDDPTCAQFRATLEMSMVRV